jgi:hypothetical protein
MPRYVKVIIGAVGFFAIYTLWMFLLPSKFELKEQIEINASIDDVTKVLLDEGVRNEWISWQYNDSELTLNSEEGEVYFWESEINNTQGTFQIELLQNETVQVEVEFLKPQKLFFTEKYELSSYRNEVKVFLFINGSYSFFQRWANKTAHLLLQEHLKASLINLKQLIENQGLRPNSEEKDKNPIDKLGST